MKSGWFFIIFSMETYIERNQCGQTKNDNDAGFYFFAIALGFFGIILIASEGVDLAEPTGAIIKELLG